MHSSRMRTGRGSGSGICLFTGRGVSAYLEGVSAYLWACLFTDTPSIPHPRDQTDACENITFNHTSYVVGNKYNLLWRNLSITISETDRRVL